MKVFTLKVGSTNLRVRSERFGCLIFDGNSFHEGNMTTLYILSLVSQGLKLQEIVEEVSLTFGVSREIIERDMNDFLRETEKKGWDLWR